MTADLGQKIGYLFARPELLEEALTHPSALASEHSRGRRGRKPAHRGYERLEFLGDRVLGLVIADLLWRRFESEPEGHLTRRLTNLVRGQALARVVPAHVATLTEGVLQAMFVTKVKVVVALVFTVSMLGAGVLTGLRTSTSQAGPRSARRRAWTRLKAAARPGEL